MLSRAVSDSVPNWGAAVPAALCRPDACATNKLKLGDCSTAVVRFSYSSTGDSHHGFAMH